jgi:hypothetical protein
VVEDGHVIDTILASELDQNIDKLKKYLGV